MSTAKKKPGAIRVDLLTTHPPRPEHFTVLFRGRAVATLTISQLRQALHDWENVTRPVEQPRHWADR